MSFRHAGQSGQVKQSTRAIPKDDGGHEDDPFIHEVCTEEGAIQCGTRLEQDLIEFLLTQPLDHGTEFESAFRVGGQRDHFQPGLG